MKKLTLLLCMLSLCAINTTFAQKKGKKEKAEKVEKTTKSKKSKRNEHCWDAGLLGGATYYVGELHCPDKGISNLRPGGGVYARYSFNDNFFIRPNFQFGQIEGSDAAFEEDWRRLRNFSFNSVFYDAALLLEWEPFGHHRYRGVKKFNRMLSPYIHSGIAGLYNKPVTNFNEPNPITQSSDIAVDKANDKFYHLAIPFGGGLRYDLNKSWMIGVEGGFRVALTDYVDGVSEAGNPGKRDWYETVNLSLGYRFPCKRDKDNDGVSDDEDACPDEAGTSKTKGCPDRDGDGVTDKSDNCPDEPGDAKLFGCPDADGDGVVDKDDDCPQLKGEAMFKGCPDTDGDGISDKDDKCPEEKGVAEEEGCPIIDTDKDGIPDKEDKCPEVAGIIANLGCPDSTATKVENSTSLVPGSTTIAQPAIGTSSTREGTITANGAPTYTTSNGVVVNTPANTTRDGATSTNTINGVTYTTNGTSDLSSLPVSEVVILDENGKVVSSSKSRSSKSSSSKKKKNGKSSSTKRVAKPRAEATITENNSDIAYTPTTTTYSEKGATNTTYSELSSEDAQTIAEAVNGVYFDTNKAMLKSESYPALSRVATVLKRYPNYALRITGHTDDVGDDLENVKLSVARARAIYNYFLKKGIDIQNISYRGCGSGTPVADNANEEGRAQNRRVEFDMMNK